MQGKITARSFATEERRGEGALEVCIRMAFMVHKTRAVQIFVRLLITRLSALDKHHREQMNVLASPIESTYFKLFTPQALWRTMKMMLAIIGPLVVSVLKQGIQNRAII